MCRWLRELSCTMDWWRKLTLWHWPLSGILLGAGFVHPLLWPLSIAGVVVFLDAATRSKRWITGMLGAWLSWSCKAGLAIWWLFSTYPIAWMPPQLSEWQLLLIGSYWFLSTISIGFGGVVAYWFVKAARSLGEKTVMFGVMVAVGWVLAEIAGSFAFSLVMLGPGVGITPALSFSYLGYLWGAIPGGVLLAKAGGVYGMSFVLVSLVLVFLQVRQRQFAVAWRCLALALLILAVTAVVFTTPEPWGTKDVRVAIIDTQLPGQLWQYPDGVRTRMSVLEKAVAAALVEEPDYLVLPEDARYFSSEQLPLLAKSTFLRRHNAPEVTVVDTGRTATERGAVLRATIYTGPRESLHKLDKQYLVPQGEYISYWMRTALALLGKDELIETAARDLSYVTGSLVDQSGLPEQAPGVLFCFESVDPLGVRKIVDQHSNTPFIAHPIAHGMFHAPDQLWQQLDTMLRVQAVFNSRYIVSAGNFSPGKVYSPQGGVFVPEAVAAGQYWQVKLVTLKIRER